MSESPLQFLRYKRNRFSARFPSDRQYTRSHFWLRKEADGAWRIGLTTFATRMLGEIVELDFEKAADAPVALGEVIGWVEGFKAVSDIFSVATGVFRGYNEVSANQPELICRDPYASGWLYEVNGVVDAESLSVEGYAEHLDQIIDKMLEKPWQGPELKDS